MRIRRSLLLLLGLMVSLAVCAPSLAVAQDSDQKVVRVGWYDSAFNHTDQFGRRSGYGYEYQQRIAIYTGWTYEYVEGSWPELFEKLIAGEIDLLSDVSYTKERASKILYSSEAMGSEGYHVFISPTNTKISPEDFSTLNGKRVGVDKNSVQEQMFVEWAKDQDVTPQIVETTVSAPETFSMLSSGELEAFVTLDTYGNTTDAVPVAKIGSSDSYFGINKSRPDIKRELDVAMNRILDDNRGFNQQLTERYNMTGSMNSFLTAKELSWLDAHGSIRVGYRDNFLPFCDADDNTSELVGTLADYLAFARTCERNGQIDFEAHAYATTEEALQALSKGEIDCVFPTSLSSYDGDAYGVVVTDPLVSTEMYATVRTADHQALSADTPMKVAVDKGNPNYETFLMDNFPNWKPVYYADSTSGLKAVASGEADAALMSNYRVGRMSDLCAKYNLSSLTTGQAMDMSFAVRQDDDELYSILNKTMRLMSDTAISSSLTSYSYAKDKTLTEYIRDHMVYFVAFVACIVVVILLLVLKNMRSSHRAAEGQKIIAEAELDPLTSLYNWNFFLVYANRIHRYNPERHMDAVVMNFDRFHSVNALHGREFGDRVLREVADEIRRFLDESDGIASRFEADRFDIYCESRDDWQEVFVRFKARMDELFHDANLHLRMGVKPWEPGEEPILQFDRARTACSLERGNFNARAVVYDEDMGQREERYQRLLEDYPRALEQHEFEVYYQPKYNIQTPEPKLSSAEALVRWQHPEHELIPPNEFIPLLENSGQILALDQYVWEEAASQIARWRDRYGTTLPVSVNLSRVDIFDPGVFSTLDGLLERYGLKPSDLKLEVTESAYTEDAEQLLQVIERLRAAGYEIEMDDFGSGYSSLNMLSTMPVDILKMDMAFVRNIERDERDFRLIELIIDIARYLKVPVIAEGVETKDQLMLLKDAGCDLVQGYYFSRPLPADEFERTILNEGD